MNPSKRISIPFITSALLACVLAAPAERAQAAATPAPRINYQGVLRDASGDPLNGAHEMTFRFFSLDTGGVEILTDTRAFMTPAGPVVVTNGLFNATLGDGAIADGSGPGTYADLAQVFRDYGVVWLEIQIGAEVLSPRVLVTASAYSLNASNLEGKPASSFLDTSASDQTKTGTISVFSNSLAFAVTASSRGGGVRAYDSLGGSGLAEVGTGNYGLRVYGKWGTGGGMPGWFKDVQDTGEAWLAPGNTGLYAFGSEAGGVFRRGTPTSFTDEAALANAGYGVFGRGQLAGGRFQGLQGSSEAMIATGASGLIGYGQDAGGIFRHGSTAGWSDETAIAYAGYGIYANGTQVGGSFFGPSSYAHLASASHGVLATGTSMGGEFLTAAPGLASAKLAYNTFGYGYGIMASGTESGGEFSCTNCPAYVRIAKNQGGGAGVGIQAGGSEYAGYFHRVLVPNSFSEVTLGNAWGVEAVSNMYYSPGAAVFYDSVTGAMAQLSRGDVAIVAYGGGAAGVFRHGTETGWDNWAHLADGSSAIVGSGAKNFVQNHPYDPDSEIVYTSLEGDEVGTYTRGNAMFQNGVARVKLNPSFAWVTNPDIGLTATVTPRGVPVAVAVESVSTSELVVRAEPGARDIAFDYVVQGLRLGFERASVVRPKRADAPIPPMAEHDEVYASHPELKAHNALERFKAMPEAAKGSNPVDLSNTEALVAAIGVGDMTKSQAKRRSMLTPKHVEEWEQAHPGEKFAEWESRPSELSRREAVGPHTAPPDSPHGKVPAGANLEPAVPVDHPSPASNLPHPLLPATAPPGPFTGMRLPVAEAVEPGDVLVNNALRPGRFVRGREAGDRGVIGIVAGEPGERFLTEAPLAVAGTVVLCRVDATEAPIAANDLLMASSLAGHAMRAGENPRQGSVIGKALEPLDAGTGVIQVLVTSR